MTACERVAYKYIHHLTTPIGVVDSLNCVYFWIWYLPDLTIELHNNEGLRCLCKYTFLYIIYSYLLRTVCLITNPQIKLGFGIPLMIIPMPFMYDSQFTVSFKAGWLKIDWTFTHSFEFGNEIEISFHCVQHYDGMNVFWKLFFTIVFF